MMLSKENSLFRNVFILLKPYRKRIVILTICIMLTSVTAMFNPILSRLLIDQGMMKGNFSIVIKFSSIIIGIFLFDQVIDFIGFLQYTYINNMLSAKLTLKAFQHAMKMKMSYFNNTNIQKIMSENMQDIASISSISDKYVLLSVTQIIKVLGGLAGLFYISWELTLFVLAAIPVKLILTIVLSQKREKTTKELMNQYSKSAFWYGETMGGINEIKLWNLYRKKTGEYVKLQRTLAKTKINSVLVDQLNQLSDLTLSTVVNNSIYILGAAMMIKSGLTLGGILTFVMYSAYVVQPITMLMNLYYQFATIKPAMERYISFLDSEREMPLNGNYIRLEDRIHIPRKIRFEDVTLSYDEGKYIMSNISFELRMGQKVAVIGSNGSGKSSVINLLLRFYKPTSGTIYMDDIDIEMLNINDYRDLFSVMSQSVHLFNTSIEDNIKMNGTISETRIKKSCNKSDASGFIDKLQDRFKTEVGYNGAKLSGGERQKVALARALAKKAPILILDEATSNYDYESEQLFNRVVRETTEYPFIITVTHRPDILKIVDKILVLDKGHMAGFGSYKQLYGKNKLFTSMIDNDFDRAEIGEVNLY